MKPHLATFLSLALIASTATAQSAPVLVTGDWLAKNLSNPKVVVIHAAAQKFDYDAGHVPGSRWIPWNAYTVSAQQGQGGLSTQLPAPEALDSILEIAGVSDDSHVIVSGGPVQSSARLFYTLEYMGLAGRVSFLDGGIDAWRESGRPTERTESKASARGTLTLKPNAAKLVDAAWLAANMSAAGVSILDARTPEFYLGESPGSGSRAGHIPNAGNVPFVWLTGDVSQFRDKAKLQRLFDQAGAKKGNKVVTYCHIGMQASALYLASRILGYDVALYDGSWEEWSRKSELPIVGKQPQ
jgi:thiosulfate/3-mercaptopyruvate sulfurtransferase